MLILISICTFDMELDLMDTDLIHILIGGNGRNVIIFAVDMSSSIKINNRKEEILILRLGPTQRLEQPLSAEKMYSINFTENNKKFYLRNSRQEFINSKQMRL